MFYFFSPDNPELLLKVIDGCGVNGRHWVFGSAATDLDYEVEVEDSLDGGVQRYTRNRFNALISDTSAFPCEGWKDSGVAIEARGAGSSSGGDGGFAGLDGSILHSSVEWAVGGGELAASSVVPKIEGTHEGPVGFQSCNDGLSSACMEDGRFRVSVHFWNPRPESAWSVGGIRA